MRIESPFWDSGFCTKHRTPIKGFCQLCLAEQEASIKVTYEKNELVEVYNEGKRNPGLPLEAILAKRLPAEWLIKRIR